MKFTKKAEITQPSAINIFFINEFGGTDTIRPPESIMALQMIPLLNKRNTERVPEILTLRCIYRCNYHTYQLKNNQD